MDEEPWGLRERETVMKNRSLAVALAFGLLLTGACGDDDDTDAATEDERGTDDTAAEVDEAGADGFCTAWVELNAGDPSPEQIREAAAIAPDGASEPLGNLADGFEAEGEAFFESEAFGKDFATVGQIANDECADEVLEVSAIDYGFEGIADEVGAGFVGIDFTNNGAELHELVILRRNDGVTQSYDEILALSEEEGGELVTEAGGSFAFPGESAATLVDLSEPGDYVAVCFIPVGSTPDAGEEGGSGPPHFTEGMKTEFTVA